MIGTAQMPYHEQVHGLVGLNYGKEPLARRLVANKDTARLFRSAVHGDPAAPLLEAFAGDRVRSTSCPFSEQAHVFSLEGHRWPLEPGRRGTDMRSSLQLGGLAAATLHLADGAGGAARAPGDHVYGDHREPYRDAGLWGSSGSIAPAPQGSGCSAWSDRERRSDQRQSWGSGSQLWRVRRRYDDTVPGPSSCCA